MILLKDHDVPAFSTENAWTKEVLMMEEEFAMSWICRQVEQGIRSFKMTRKINSLLTYQLRPAVATAVGVPAARAKMLADQEERQMELLMAYVIETEVVLLLGTY